jgi:hypothetical protein
MYINGMARFLVILLVVLIPLRGWSVERMSIEMAQQTTHSQASAMPANCPLMAQGASEDDKSSTDAKDHFGCKTCQLCMGLSVQPNLFFSYSEPPPQASLATTSTSFISADLTRRAKPPIL